MILCPYKYKATLYSSYIKGATTVDSLTVKMGVDVGENTVTALTLETSGSDTYAVRTNSAATTLTVKAPSAVVEHYDEVGTVNVVQVAMNSYHEHGSVQGNINLAQGKVALEAGSSVSNVVVKAIDNVTPTSQGVKVVVEESAEANLVISEVSGVSVPVEGNGAANVEKVEDIAGKEASIGSATYATLSEALTAAKDGDVVTLLADSTLTSTNVINKNITVDLNGAKITSKNFEISATYNAVFKNGTVVSTLADGNANNQGFIVQSNAGLSLINIDYKGACFAVFPAKDASSVNIVNSYIHDVSAGVATNARGDLSNNIKVNIDASVIDCGEIAAWINVPGSLSINDSVLKGGWQAVMVRSGTAVIDNSELVLKSGNSSVQVNDTKYLEGDKVWGSGDNVPRGALIVGDYTAGGYPYTATCTLKNTKVSTNIAGWTRALIVLAQNGSRETILNYDAACNISSSDYLICNYPLTNVKKGQITVNGAVVQIREQ